jgi:hypothetical protein
MEGTGHGIWAGGKGSGNVRLELQGKNQFTLHLTNISSADGEKIPDMSSVYTRVKPTTRKDFVEFCKLAEGRWLTEMTLDEDIPGFGKKGEVIVGCMDHSLAVDGNAIIGKHSYGQGWVTELKTYDPEKNEIMTNQVMSDGTIGHIVERKSGEEWIIENTEIYPDGTKSLSIGTTVFSKDGKTWTIKFGNPGQPKDEWTTSVWRRIGR